MSEAERRERADHFLGLLHEGGGWVCPYCGSGLRGFNADRLEHAVNCGMDEAEAPAWDANGSPV